MTSWFPSKMGELDFDHPFLGKHKGDAQWFLGSEDLSREGAPPGRPPVTASVCACDGGTECATQVS